MTLFSLRCPVCVKMTRAEEVVKFAHYRCQVCKNVINVTNVTISEWLGFHYPTYLASIQKVIKADPFTNLRAQNRADIARGKFSAKQVTALKSVLSSNFDAGTTIRDIARDIKSDVKIKDLKLYNDDGDLTQTIPKEVRAINIARTETTRLANLGAKDHYANGGIEEYAWLAAADEATCPDCMELNGRIFTMDADTSPPLHSLCRCTIVPVTR